MTKQLNRNVIYKQLLLKVTISILLLNVIFAIIIIQESINIQRNNEIELQSKIKNEIIALSDFQVSALKTFEKSFYDIQKKALEKITQKKHKDIESANLEEVLKAIDLDTVLHDLYVIDNNIVVNTTYKPDLGLDFSAFGHDRIIYLNTILRSRRYYPERFQFESSTKRLKSYSYQATKDGKFLVEIGSYSEIADKIMKMFVDRLIQITEENEKIVSINYWFGDKNYQFPLIDKSINRHIPDSTIVWAFKKQEDVVSNFKAGKKDFNARFMYVKQNPESRLPDFALSIITDISDRNQHVFKIVKRQTVFAVSFLILIAGFIIVAMNSAKKIE
ncbi:MAG: hypothetical protein MI739_05040 [Bacteroidales bacterium]|nr:hypothetical protein [Bacteroidales bacterium]